MNTNINTLDSTGEKRLPETSVQNIPHNLTTIQGIQGIQNIVQSNVQTIQSTQNVVSTIAPTTAIVGKSISLDLNPKLSLMKSVVQSGNTPTVDTSKLTTTLCSVGPTVRIISPGMLSTVERQSQSQPQVQAQATQQVVTTIPATYHVPRGPAAVANISAPRSTVATPIVRASTGQSVVPISRTGVSTTVSNTPWPTKTSVVYAQPQRHAVPPASRVTTRPSPAVYSGQQSRLVVPAQARPIQTTVVTNAPTGASPRLLTPVLQSNNAITRMPVPQTRPVGPQITNVTTSAVQTIRHQPQTLQTNQQVPRATTAQTNRIAVSTPVGGTTNRIAAPTSVTVQPAIGRQLSINPATGTATTAFNRVVIPTQQVQQQSQTHQQNARVVQTITPLANLATVSRVIATTSNPSNLARVTQSTPTSGARITGMTLHSLPIATTRTIPTPAKPVVTGQAIAQAIQIKPGGQPTALRVTPIVSTTSMTTSATSVPIATATTPSAATIIINNSNNSNNPPTSIPQSSLYTQYRQATVQPVRLLVEPTHEENHGKPNASPRPSILRKRDHDNSPAKSIAKNLVPVLTALASGVVIPPPSPPSPSRNDRDGCQSSGSTTVSATSSPGLDEEPEQSRIIINQTMEMSPRKKPRKQQLTGVELTEQRCNDEEMQFITEDKLKREKDDIIKDKYCMDRKTNSNNPQDGMGIMANATMVVRARPTPSLLGSSWKNRWSGRLHHYRRPGDVRPREERRPTVAEIAQQKYVLQKIHGWKVYQLTAQMEDLAELEKQVHGKLKATLLMLESQQSKSRQDDELERANELIKGNMQRSSLISEGMSEARTQLIAIFQHKSHVNDILQRCGNKRAQKKRDK